MKKLFYLSIISILTGAVLLSCSQDSSEVDDPNAIDPDDHLPPVLTVSRPADNQVYISNDSIIVGGAVTDEKALYRGAVQLKNDANNVIVAETYYGSLFLQSINFRLAYKAVASSVTNFSVLILFEDHGRNSVSDTIRVKVNP